MRQIVDRDEPPGLLAYVDGEPAGWCSIEPREKFGRLENSRTFKRVDDRPSVWSLNCFVVGKQHRRRGLMTTLLEAAIENARRRGAKIIEAYPVEPTESSRVITAIPASLRPSNDAAFKRSRGRDRGR